VPLTKKFALLVSPQPHHERGRTRDQRKRRRMARKPPMSAALARTIRTADGSTLRTRGEAAEYMTALTEQRARYSEHREAFS